jgi:hypothetical protein
MGLSSAYLPLRSLATVRGGGWLGVSSIIDGAVSAGEGAESALEHPIVAALSKHKAALKARVCAPGLHVHAGKESVGALPGDGVQGASGLCAVGATGGGADAAVGRPPNVAQPPGGNFTACHAIHRQLLRATTVQVCNIGG